LTKSKYKLKQIKEELFDFDLKNLFPDMENAEYILSCSKDFYLYQRISFLILEYEKIFDISNNLKNSNSDTSNNFLNKLLDHIRESNEKMNDLYNCHSGEINSLTKKIYSLSKEVAIKLGSDGWGGDIIALGSVKILNDINRFLEKHYEFLNSKDNLANMWHYDYIHFCDYGRIGGIVGLLNPEYEDFMFL